MKNGKTLLWGAGVVAVVLLLVGIFLPTVNDRPEGAGAGRGVEKGGNQAASAVGVVEVLPLIGGSGSKRDIADVLEGADLSDPTARDRAVKEIFDIEQDSRKRGEEKAQKMGLPLRVTGPDGFTREVAGLDDNGEVLYRITHNANAAISTGVVDLRLAYGLTGSGVTVGVWDNGSVRASHREFSGGRVRVVDNVLAQYHATHVTGTIVASGVSAAAKGMGVEGRVDSYDWNNDLSEMTARGATGAGETSQVYLSNHSYGYTAGWLKVNWVGANWVWHGGSGQTDARFGQYNTQARSSDAVAAAVPYLLTFRSAGNDRTENPVAGQKVYLSPSALSTVVYNPSTHPMGDGGYLNGYGNVSFDAVAKNVVTVGSVTPAVTSGVRSPGAARMSSFSSWGPTDDGRIKPDLVANGDMLYSTASSSDSAYGSMGGTSMAAPNATGTAMLLVGQYSQLFSGGAMRASTLKGLLIHTADDMGTAGPDYQYGWGLINGLAAGELLEEQAASPESPRMIEDFLDGSRSPIVHEIVWDGVSPIRATLVWTDPAGTARSTNDDRSPSLVHDLDLHIVGPNGEIFRPYVMPFVGTWTAESLVLPATTGINNTDNVEMVDIFEPGSEGVYQVVVSHQGGVTGTQHFSLLIDGGGGGRNTLPELKITDFTIGMGVEGGSLRGDFSGEGLDTVTQVRLSRSEGGAIYAKTTSYNEGWLRAHFELPPGSSGEWDVVISNDTEEVVLANAAVIKPSIWSGGGDSPTEGWGGLGSGWDFVADETLASGGVFVGSAGSLPVTRLESPAFFVPLDARNLELRFWHEYRFDNIESRGRLVVSVDGGEWVDAKVGAAFSQGDYNTPSGDEAYWGGSSEGRVEVVLLISDWEMYAGHTVRFGWQFYPSEAGSENGWWKISNVSLTGDWRQDNQAPTIGEQFVLVDGVVVVAGEDGSYAISGDTAVVRLTATDPDESDTLSWNWSVQSDGGGRTLVTPVPSALGQLELIVQVEKAGEYELTASAIDGGGRSAAALLALKFDKVAERLEISPAQKSLNYGDTLDFTAQVLDVLGQAAVLGNSGTSVRWSVAGEGGTINQDGRFFASGVGRGITVTASIARPWGELTGEAVVDVLPRGASVELSNLEHVYDGSPKAAVALTVPAGLAVKILYNGSEVLPIEVGTYNVTATIEDAHHTGSAEGQLRILPNGVGEGYAQWREDMFGENDTEGSEGADPDGDGMPNLAEYHLGTDPRDPGSKLQVRIAAGRDGQLELTVTPVVDTGTYLLYSASDILGNWGQGEVLELDATDPVHTLPRQTGQTQTFYRVFYLPPSQP